MALIKFKALFRAVIFDVGWRMIKLAGYEFPNWDWNGYWERELFDRAESQLRILVDPHTPNEVKGWAGF